MKYALESYLPQLGFGQLPETEGRVRGATEELRREGTPIRYVRSVFLRADEICFLIFETSSREAVAEAARRAGVGFERVVEVDVGPAERSR